MGRGAQLLSNANANTNALNNGTQRPRRHQVKVLGIPENTESVCNFYEMFFLL